MVRIWLKSFLILLLFMLSLIWLPLSMLYITGLAALIGIHKLEKELKGKKE